MDTPPKIMIIEDDALMRSLLETLLQLEGYCVVQANKERDVEEIIATMRLEKPALVLMDVHLQSPQVDGFDLLTRIRNDRELTSTRVLLSSGADYLQRSHEAGSDGFIMKPYMPDEFVWKIQQALGA